MRNLYLLLFLPLLMPHLALLILHPNKKIIEADLKRWMEILTINASLYKGFVYLLSFHKEFRNLFYYRIGGWKHLLNLYCPQISTLYLHTPIIEEGLFIQHGFATIVNAHFIGKNCWINQQVTVGFTNTTDCPTIMENVRIHAGAKVIGNVTIGKNSIIGANAVVVKDVPENSVVGGVPARIIKTLS